MMKKAQSLLLIIGLSLFLVSGCSPLGGGDLEVKLSGLQILIDAPGTSCKAKLASKSDDVPSLSFSISSISVLNPEPVPLTIAYIEVRMNSGALKSEYVKKIAGDDLVTTWMNSDTATKATVSVGATPTENLCPFALGGVDLIDKKSKAFGYGSVYVYALYDDNGTTKSVYGRANFNWEY